MPNALEVPFQEGHEAFFAQGVEIGRARMPDFEKCVKLSRIRNGPTLVNCREDGDRIEVALKDLDNQRLLSRSNYRSLMAHLRKSNWVFCHLPVVATWRGGIIQPLD